MPFISIALWYTFSRSVPFIINRFDFVCSLGNTVMNDLVKFIQESHPYIKKEAADKFSREIRRTCSLV